MGENLIKRYVERRFNVGVPLEPDELDALVAYMQTLTMLPGCARHRGRVYSSLFPYTVP